MKLSRVLFAFLFVFLLASHTISSRLPPTNQGESLETQDDDFSKLMGSEECKNANDEECMNRRMVAEAHLDYIYTQRNKPKKP